MQENFINDLVQNLKRTLRELWGDTALQPVAQELESFFDQMKRSNLSVNVTFDIVVHSHDGTAAKPVIRIPLAVVSAVRGLGKLSKADAKRMLELTRLATTDPSAAEELRKIGDASARDPNYSIVFGEVPDLSSKGLHLCPTCHGGGVKLGMGPS